MLLPSHGGNETLTKELEAALRMSMGQVCRAIIQDRRELNRAFCFQVAHFPVKCEKFLCKTF